MTPLDRHPSARPSWLGRVGPYVAAGLLLGFAFPSEAAVAPGDHHMAGTLRCNDCHVMHYNPSSASSVQGGGFWYGGGGPHRALLRNQVNDLCLACHDGTTFGTDVLGTNTGSQPTIVRAGGYLGRFGLVGLPENGHTLDSLANAPGSTPSWSPEDENGPGRGLTCINCHAPHGSVDAAHPTGSQYRNLRTNPGNGRRQWVTYNGAAGVNDITRDVFVRAPTAYDESSVDWNEPNQQRSALARWCGGCHSNIHGNFLGGGISGPGTAGGSLDEHPVEDENLESDMLSLFNGHVNRVKVMSSVGIWNPAGPDVTPTCVSCHRAHGNGNPDGLIYRSGTGVPTEDGDSNGSSRDDLCGQCHTETPSLGIPLESAGRPFDGWRPRPRAPRWPQGER